MHLRASSPHCDVIMHWMMQLLIDTGFKGRQAEGFNMINGFKNMDRAKFIAHFKIN